MTVCKQSNIVFVIFTRTNFKDFQEPMGTVQHPMNTVEEQISVQLPTCSWQRDTARICCLAGCAAIDQYLLHAGPTAANQPQRRVSGKDETDGETYRQTHGRTDARQFHRPCSTYYASIVNKKNVLSLIGWRRHVVSRVRQWTKLTHVGPGYNWDRLPSSGGYTISGCNQPTRSIQPCIPPGSLNRVPASPGVQAGMSPLPGGR